MEDTARWCLSTQEAEAEDRAQSQALVLTDFKSSTIPMAPYLKEVYLKENHRHIPRKYR